MSQAYWFDSTPFTTYGEFNPTPVFSGSDSGHTVKQLQAGQEIRFTSTSTSVGIYSYFSTAAGRTYVLLQDNVQVGSVSIPATGSGAFQVFSLATGLSGSHEYRIVCITPVQPASGNWYDGYVELDAGTLSAVVHPNRTVWGMYGDSITGMGSSHQTDIGSAIISDCRYGDMWIFTNATNTAMFISGVSGGKVVNTGRDNTANIPANVDAVRVEYGINDQPDLPSGNATFQTAYGVMIDNIRTRIGAGKPIICLQPFPQNSATQRSNLATLIQAAINGKANVFYTGTDNWVPTTTAYEPDGTHPNAAGYAILANRQTPIWSSAAISISGPSSGNINTASSTFTITLANGATFTGDQDITLTTSNGTINATVAGGSVSNNNTSAVTATPVAGATSFTCTYTPTASGVQTITPTTTQLLWTMPGATSYQVGSVLPGSPSRGRVPMFAF